MDQAQAPIPNTQSCLDDDLRIVLVGKSGVGKSATGNTIVGKEEFLSCNSSDMVTETVKHVRTNFNTRNLLVIDTPGLFSTTQADSRYHVRNEIEACINLGAPGFHAIVFVLSAATRFTVEDKNCFDEFFSIFGPTFYDYAVVVFTSADYLKSKRQTLNDYIGTNKVLKEFLLKCGNRMLAFNNKDPSEIDRENQLSHLIHLITSNCKNRKNKYYSDKKFEDAKKLLQRKERELKKKMEEEMKMLRKQIREELEEEYKKKIADIEEKLRKADIKPEVLEEVAREASANKKDKECMIL